MYDPQAVFAIFTLFSSTWYVGPVGLCRWSNIYSKHLLRVLYGSGGGADDADESGLRRPSKDQGEQKRESAPKKAGGETRLSLH